MMVTELKKLPPLSPLPPTAKPKKIVTKPKQNKNLIKVTVDCSVSLQLSNANGKVDLPSRSAAHARPVPTLLHFDVPCGLRGWKNRPAPFPGRISYNTTKPGSVCPVA